MPSSRTPISGVPGALLPRLASARAGVERAGRRLAAARPAIVLAPLVALQLAVAAGVALTAARDGWAFATPAADHWVAAWELGRLDVTAEVAYGLPALVVPLAAAVGTDPAGALPLVVLLQAAIGGPAVLLALYGIGSRLAGRLLGYAAALGWAVAPLLVLGFFYPGERVFLGVPYDDYRGLVHDTVLPHALGLTLGPVFPSLLAVTAAAWLAVRSLDTGGRGEALLAGLAAGLAIAIDPGNAVFLPAPLLAFLVAGRARHAAAFAAALLPSLAALAIWRWAGTGGLGLEAVRFAWEDFRINLIHLRGAGWSLLLVVWIAVAGVFAAVRRAPARGVLLAAWFAAFFVLGAGAFDRGQVLNASVYQVIAPGYPAFVLLAASLALLVPGAGRRRPAAFPPGRGPEPSRGLAAAVALLAVYPLALVALAAAS